jgi:hypothetical protein
MKKLKYKGKTFFKYPDGYYRNGKTTLHKFKYENKHGTLLPCFHLHHKDGNKLNNNINNLELLTPQEHALVHKVMRRKFLFRNQLPLDIKEK